MLFKKDELKLLWPFYLCYLLFGLSAVVTPFMIVYFQSLGFSYVQLAIITISTGIGIFLFEIPTGVMADSVSRKYSVLIGYAITGLSVMLVPFFTNFYIITLLLFIAGIGMSFMSGADEAWVIDNLHYHKRKDLQHEFFVKTQILVAIGFIFTPILGALIAKSHGMTWLWFIFGMGFILNMLVLLFFAKEKYAPKRVSFLDDIRTYYSKSFKGLKFIIQHKTIFVLVLASMLAMLMSLGANGEQPFLVSLSLPQYALGYVYSVMAIFLICGSMLSRYLIKYEIKNVMAIMTLSRMILLIAIVFIYPPLILLASMLIIFNHTTFSVTDPLMSTYFHKFIPKKIRATIVSAKSMMMTLMGTIVGILGGILLDIYGPKNVMVIGGILGIFALITYMQLED